MRNEQEQAYPSGEGQFAQTGLTKREYFAAMAMQGILSNPTWKMNYIHAAQEAIIQADALIRHLDDFNFASSLKA